jgi:iron complex transport system substrate-binding protein
MRICSLVPGATEIVVLLGFADSLVGISHECDYPEAVRKVPVMITPVVDSGARTSAEIDEQVKALASTGQPLYRVDEGALAEARPDLILTQDVCHVCAVTPDTLLRAIGSLPHRPQLLTVAPQSLNDVIDDVERIGTALGAESRGRDLARSLRSRIAAVRDKAAGRSRPRVACLEWLAPLYVGGHWVPEMVDLAGGLDALGTPGQPSRQVSMEALSAAAPEVAVLMPCGFSVSRTVAEVTAVCRTDPALSRCLTSVPKTFAVDAGSYFSRPGPRLIDGLELMADICGGCGTSTRSADTIVDLTGNFCLTGMSR